MKVNLVDDDETNFQFYYRRVKAKGMHASSIWCRSGSNNGKETSPLRKDSALILFSRQSFVIA